MSISRGLPSIPKSDDRDMTVFLQAIKAEVERGRASNNNNLLSKEQIAQIGKLLEDNNKRLTAEIMIMVAAKIAAKHP